MRIRFKSVFLLLVLILILVSILFGVLTYLPGLAAPHGSGRWQGEPEGDCRRLALSTAGQGPAAGRGCP